MQHGYGDIQQVLMHPEDETEAFASALIFAVADLRILPADQDIRPFFLDRFSLRLDESRRVVSDSHGEDLRYLIVLLSVLFQEHMRLYPDRHNPIGM